MASYKDTLLEFPCEFPLKIMGKAHDDLAQVVLDIVTIHAPDFDAATMEMQPSTKNNYLSLTYTFHAISHKQLNTLYHKLSTHPLVKVVL